MAKRTKIVCTLGPAVDDESKLRAMIAAGMVGTVAKFMSATHMGIAEKPFLGVGGAKPGLPRPSTASASLPRRS